MTPKPSPQYQATHTPERHHECPGRQKLQMALLFVSEMKNPFKQTSGRSPLQQSIQPRLCSQTPSPSPLCGHSPYRDRQPHASPAREGPLPTVPQAQTPAALPLAWGTTTQPAGGQLGSETQVGWGGGGSSPPTRWHSLAVFCPRVQRGEPSCRLWAGKKGSEHQPLDMAMKPSTYTTVPAPFCNREGLQN